MLGEGIGTLSASERWEFIRLLLSLSARHPKIIENLRAFELTLANGLDSDMDLLTGLAEAQLPLSPSQFANAHLPLSLADRSIAMSIGLTNDFCVGARLVNSHWHVRTLSTSAPNFVLGDNPLIRFHAFDSPEGVWILPLSPRQAFIAANRRSTLTSLINRSSEAFVKRCNRDSARQVDQYVFSVDNSDSGWIGPILRRKAAAQRTAAISAQ